MFQPPFTNRSVGHRGVFVAAVVISLVVARGAAADDTHYRGIPIGAHAIGLGGAFTGVVDDASAAYFNPAGLVLEETFGIAGGFSINAWERVDLDRIYAQPDGAASATNKVGRSLPIFIGAGFKFGPRDANDRKKYAIGISVVEPIFSSLNVFAKIEGDPLGLSDSYKVDDNDRGTWYGLSFAGRLNPKHSIGASLYLSVRKLNHSEVGLTLGDGMQVPGESDPVGTFVGANTAANNDSLAFKAFHFALRLGWLYSIKPRLQLGVMVQPPGIPLKQTANVFAQAFINDNTDPMSPPTTTALYFDQRVDANLPIPAEIEAGVQYWPAEKVMLAFDASFHAPVPGGAIAQVPEPVSVGGNFWDNNTARRALGNAAVAGEFFINDKVMMETGFFTDLSSALKIPDNPDRYYNTRIHRFGGTLSVGVNISGVSLAVGSTVLYGRGKATGVVVDLGNRAVDYTLADARSRIVYLHITGATQAASDVSKKAAEGIRARRKRQKQEAEEEAREAAEQEQQTVGPTDSP